MFGNMPTIWIYQNFRPAYVDTFMDKLVNREFVAKTLGEGLSAKQVSDEKK